MKPQVIDSFGPFIMTHLWAPLVRHFACPPIAWPVIRMPFVCCPRTPNGPN